MLIFWTLGVFKIFLTLSNLPSQMSSIRYIINKTRNKKGNKIVKGLRVYDGHNLLANIR